MAEPTPCRGCGGRTASDRTLVIADPHDLDQLRWTWKRFDDIRIVAGTLPPSQRDAWEDRLTSLYTECGCNAGGIATLLAIAVLGAAAIVAGRLSADITGAAVALFAILGAATIGKAIGIAAARIRLRNERQRLRPLLEHA